MTTPALGTCLQSVGVGIVPGGVSVRADMRHGASTVLRNHRILDTLLVVVILQRRGFKVPIAGTAAPTELQGHVNDGVLAENIR